jgi:GNAT superfamily N-acetyltransferase
MADRPAPESFTDVDCTVREATHDDYDDVVAFTSDTWSERGGSDYIPGVYHDWIDKDDSITLVADAGDVLVSIAQIVVLSTDEAWAQGMRVHPDYRGRGVSVAVNTALFDWARDQGATVARNMVFSWNVAGLGASRAAGFRPCSEFRWVHPTPDADATGSDGHATVDEPTVAWRYWQDSDARAALRGLGLALGESWAMREVTRDVLETAASDTAVFAVTSPAGARGAAYRTRTYEREDDDGVEQTWAEYGVGAWTDVDAARELLAAVQRDAASLDADRTRVLVPEDPRHVMEASLLRAEIADEPDFVNAADLTGDYPDYA